MAARVLGEPRAALSGDERPGSSQARVGQRAGRAHARRPRREALRGQMLRGGRFSLADTKLGGQSVGSGTTFELAGATTEGTTTSAGQAGVVKPEHRLHLSAVPGWPWCFASVALATWSCPCMCSPASTWPAGTPSWHSSVAARLPRTGSTAKRRSSMQTRRRRTNGSLACAPLARGQALASPAAHAGVFADRSFVKALLQCRGPGSPRLARCACCASRSSCCSCSPFRSPEGRLRVRTWAMPPRHPLARRPSRGTPRMQVVPAA